jgi:hypothetical protein
MNTIYRIFWFAALSCMVLSCAGCGNGDDPGETAQSPEAAGGQPTLSLGTPNPYVKNLPQLERERIEEAKQLQQELRQLLATDLEKGEAFRLQVKEKARLWDEKISEYVGTNLVGQTIPLKPLEGRPYAFDDLTIAYYTGADKIPLNSLKTKTTATITQDLTGDSADVGDFILGRNFSIYVKAVDLDGNDIPDIKGVSLSSARGAELVEGRTFELYLNVGSRDVVRLDNFGGFVEITRDEYHAK